MPHATVQGGVPGELRRPLRLTRRPVVVVLKGEPQWMASVVLAPGAGTVEQVATFAVGRSSEPRAGTGAIAFRALRRAVRRGPVVVRCRLQGRVRSAARRGPVTLRVVTTFRPVAGGEALSVTRAVIPRRGGPPPSGG